MRRRDGHTSEGSKNNLVRADKRVVFLAVLLALLCRLSRLIDVTVLSVSRYGGKICFITIIACVRASLFLLMLGTSRHGVLSHRTASVLIVRVLL